MTTPLTTLTASQQGTASLDVAQRQRVDKILRHLPEAPDPGQSPVGTADLVEPIQRINGAMRPYGVEFDLDTNASRVVTRIIDVESGEVIRQIPTEEVLRIAERLDDIVGRLISQEA
ncbi:MAG: flagellar protein FlaG [Porticoccaceae bacterium]|jgi:flagellar protein FlaG